MRCSRPLHVPAKLEEMPVHSPWDRDLFRVLLVTRIISGIMISSPRTPFFSLIRQPGSFVRRSKDRLTATRRTLAQPGFKLKAGQPARSRPPRALFGAKPASEVRSTQRSTQNRWLPRTCGWFVCPVQISVSSIIISFQAVTKEDFKELVNKVESKIGALENKFGAIKNKVGAIENKVGVIENKIGALENKIDGTAMTVSVNLSDFFSIVAIIAMVLMNTK